MVFVFSTTTTTTTDTAAAAINKDVTLEEECHSSKRTFKRLTPENRQFLISLGFKVKK
jgi:hypothetical protein